MKHSHFRLESFDTEGPLTERMFMTTSEVEEARLTAFEQGYSAGWENSSATRDSEEVKLRSELGQAIQEMNFTYHEAWQNLLTSLKPLIVAMSEKFFPEAAFQTLPIFIAEQINLKVKEEGSGAVTISAAPNSIPILHEILSGSFSFRLDFNPDHNLSEHQAFLKFSSSEVRIDLDEVIEKVRSEIDRYFQSKSEDSKHG